MADVAALGEAETSGMPSDFSIPGHRTARQLNNEAAQAARVQLALVQRMLHARPHTLARPTSDRTQWERHVRG